MIKKFLQYFWGVRFEFTKYFIIGFSGLFLDLGLLWLFVKIFNFNPTLSLVFTQIILIIYNFLLNKYWSFKNKELPQKQFVKYLILFVINYFIGIIIMYLFNELLDFQAISVRAITIAMSVSWNFILYKYWVYK